MRYIFYALLSLLLASPAVAQPTFAVDKGSILLGGSAGFQTQGFEDVEGRISTITINPVFGIFLTRGLAVGAEVIINRTSFEDVSVNTLGIGPLLAYYFGGPESQAFPFLSGGVAYVSNSNDGFDTSGVGADISAGVAIMMARNAALTFEAFAQFVSLSAEGVDESTGANTYGVRAGVNVFIF